jgi:hypothetical protein
MNGDVNITGGYYQNSILQDFQSLWTQNGTNIYRTTGYVGIMSTYPYSALDIRGTMQASNAIIFADSAGASYTENWIGRYYNGQDWLHIGGYISTDTLRRTAFFANNIYFSGNVGINISTPVTSLQINGGYASAFTWMGNLQLVSATPQLDFVDSDANDWCIHVNSNKMYFIRQGWSYTDMVLDGTGNIGIGTESPDTNLTIQGDNVNAPYLLNVGGSSNGRLRTRHITGKDPNSTALGDLYLQYSTDTATRHVYFNWTNANVGIQTATPAMKLEVAGGIYVRGGGPGASGASNNGYSFGTGGDNDSGMFSDQDGEIRMYINNGINSTFAQYHHYVYQGHSLIGITLHVDYDYTGLDSEGVTLYAGDNTNPRSQYVTLDIVHSINNYLRLRVIGWQYWTTPYQEVTYATVENTTGWYAGCSRKIKTDIVPVTDTYTDELIDLLRTTPVYFYKRNDAPDTPEVGLITEDTPEIMGSDGVSLRPIKTIGFLMTVVKSQQKQLKELAAELEQLKNSKQ